ncbi:hypothetical protein [Streptomyces asiaticus]|uniref:hypothetical protein n=1 Tax=Streptomyces asiaticus TaxID=114695 RepID=UPI003F66D41F
MPSIFPSASGGEQRPASDGFDQLTADLPRMAPFRAMFLESVDQLLEDRPEGFSVADVGWLAWQSLPETLHRESMERFFHREWLELENDDEAMARYEREQKTRTELAAALDEREMALVLGNEVPPGLDASIARLARSLIGGAR